MRFWDGKIQEFTLLEFLGSQTKNFGEKNMIWTRVKKKPPYHFGQVDFNMFNMTRVVF
jgi:hypothetical protein